MNKLSPTSQGKFKNQDTYPNITGGGFVSTGPTLQHSRLPATQLESATVFENNYKGATYAVKYLGIVDGTMGILSRKMALQTINAQITNTIQKQRFQSPQNQNKPQFETSIFTSRSPSFGPVLGQKYTSKTDQEILSHLMSITEQQAIASRHDGNSLLAGDNNLEQQKELDEIRFNLKTGTQHSLFIDQSQSPYSVHLNQDYRDAIALMSRDKLNERSEEQTSSYTAPLKPSLVKAGQQISSQVVVSSPQRANLHQPMIQRDQTIVQYDQSQPMNEQQCGYPMPELYNQHYINKYAFPKGLQSYKKSDLQRRQNERVSIYDIKAIPERKGISGWKLTKKPMGSPSSVTHREASISAQEFDQILSKDAAVLTKSENKMNGDLNSEKRRTISSLVSAQQRDVKLFQHELGLEVASSLEDLSDFQKTQNGFFFQK